MGYGVDPELLKVVAAIIGILAAIVTSIVGPIIGLFIFLIKRSMEKGQREIKSEIHNLSINVSQLLSQKVNVYNMQPYQPPELIKKLDGMEEEIKSLKGQVKMIEVVEEE